MRTCWKLNIRCVCSTEYVQCFRHAQQIYCQDFCWRGRGCKLGRGGGVVDMKSWSKMLFLGTFWKITTYWSPLDERVRSSFAEKTAQKPLKNRSNLDWKTVQKSPQEMSGFWAVFLSKIWAVWTVFPKKPPKPLKPLKSCWKTAQTAQILSGFRAGSRPGMKLSPDTHTKMLRLELGFKN